MEALIAGDRTKRELWAQILRVRMQTGYPYLIFTDTANRTAPPEYRHHNLRIYHSNLCTEIILSDGPDESFVCCLLSLNMPYCDKWKDTDAVAVLVYFLDTPSTTL
ncbi:MAG: hypothetical protein RMJ88_13670 [Thermogemmata sp.]|nr:hypothetical protein [Thermogemmata sp.]